MSHDDPFAGKTVHADWAYFLDVSGTYTPVLSASTTPPNLGDAGTAVGNWHRNGHLITFNFRFEFAGAGVSAGSGTYTVSTPFNVETNLYGTPDIFGAGYVIDIGTAANRAVFATAFNDASTVFMRADGGSVANNHPFIFAVGDFISGQGSYVADPAGLPT